MNISEREQKILEDFAYFPSWEEKYEYLIDLGKHLPALPSEYKTEAYLIRGCQSQVWLHSEIRNGQLFLQADADAVITKGLIALLVYLFSESFLTDFNKNSFDFIEKIGLHQHLSPTRSNGLRSMVLYIQQFIQQYQTQQNSINNLTVEEKKNFEYEIIEVLKTIFDPEIPVDIYALGLIYQIHISNAAEVIIEMTLTSPNCPVAETLPQEVQEKVALIEGLSDVQVKIVFEPAWHKDMMSEEAKLELGFL